MNKKELIVREEILGSNKKVAADIRRKLEAAGVLVVNLLSSPGGACHLEARRVGRLIPEIPAETKFLFIENVGNLVCPAGYDLGENLRCVLLSAREGDDKPKKYPKAFASADCLIITKSDLIPYVPFDLEKAGNEAQF